MEEVQEVFKHAVGGKHLAMPAGLSKRGQEAWRTIMANLKRYEITDASTGGCTAFVQPEAWHNRGERYGQGSVLIIIYDGGDLRRFFNMDACFGMGVKNCYLQLEEMQAALGEHGFYFEECTGWYAAVFDDRK